MRKHLLSLVVLLLFLFSFSSISYAEVVKSKDFMSYIVTGENDTLSEDTLIDDLYIPKGCSLTITSDIKIYGNVYVFGTLRIAKSLDCWTLNCLHYNSMSAGPYDYGYLEGSGTIKAYKLNVNANYLNTPIPAPHVHTWKSINERKSCADATPVPCYCTGCGKVSNESVGPTAHVFGNWTTSTPTCVTAGYKTRSCIFCEYSETIKIPATGIHFYDSWSVEQKATAYVAGKEARYCNVCGAAQFRSIPKLTRKISADEKKVKKTTNTFFKYLKKYDIAKMKKCFATPKKVKFFSTKKNVAKYVRKHNKALTYKIRDIKVSKRTATVTVACNYYDGYDCIYNSFDDVVHRMSSKKRSESAVDKYQYQRLLYYDKYYGGYNDSTFTMKLRKVGKNWKLLNPSRALYNAMHCNYTLAYNDYF